MGRVDTRRVAPPVRIGLANANVQQYQMARAAAVTRLARGAGNFGQKEARFASVPMRLRIQVNAGPNTEPGRQGLIPVGVTRRKRGYPAIVELPTSGK
jgi:hypothetical protein